MVQDYLDQCIQSVVNQTYRNLEIILVNDGSPDKSPEICEKWKKLDNRIIIIHKKNGGLSSARNAGLKIAKGSYIAFLDSDDWLDKTCYEKTIIIALKTNADIVGYDIYESYPNETIVKSHIPTFPTEVFNSIEQLQILFTMWPLVWAKLYKREFIIKNNLSFIEGILYEDNPFVLGCWIRNPITTFLKEPLHHYRLERKGQITFGLNPKTKDVFKMLDMVHSDFVKNKMEKQFIYLIDWTIQNVVWLYNKTPDNLKSAYLQEMRLLFLSFLKKGLFRPWLIRRRNIMSFLKVVFMPKSFLK